MSASRKGPSLRQLDGVGRQRCRRACGGTSGSILATVMDVVEPSTRSASRVRPAQVRPRLCAIATKATTTVNETCSRPTDHTGGSRLRRHHEPGVTFREHPADLLE